MSLVQESTRKVTTQGFTESVKHRVNTRSGHFWQASVVDIYKRKPEAFLREVGCNGLDATRSIGSDRPLDLFLPSAFQEQITIRDYGPGLSHEDMMSLYSTGFESSKQATRSDSPERQEFASCQVGQFGIGKYAPFGVYDSFTVDSYHKGTLRTYVIFKDEEGCPATNALPPVPTDQPDGLAVTVPCKEGDFSDDLIRKVFQWFQPRPNVVGQPDFWKNAPSILWENDHCMVVSESVRKHGNLSVLAGPILYEFDLPYSYYGSRAGEWKSCYTVQDCHKVLLKLDFNQVTPIPGRESLANDERTTAHIQEQATKALITLREQIGTIMGNTNLPFTERLLAKTIGAVDRGALNVKFNSETIANHQLVPPTGFLECRSLEHRGGAHWQTPYTHHLNVSNQETRVLAWYNLASRLDAIRRNRGKPQVVLYRADMDIRIGYNKPLSHCDDIRDHGVAFLLRVEDYVKDSQIRFHLGDIDLYELTDLQEEYTRWEEINSLKFTTGPSVIQPPKPRTKWRDHQIKVYPGRGCFDGKRCSVGDVVDAGTPDKFVLVEWTTEYDRSFLHQKTISTGLANSLYEHLGIQVVMIQAKLKVAIRRLKKLGIQPLKEHSGGNLQKLLRSRVWRTRAARSYAVYQSIQERWHADTKGWFLGTLYQLPDSGRRVPIDQIEPAIREMHRVNRQMQTPYGTWFGPPSDHVEYLRKRLEKALLQKYPFLHPTDFDCGWRVKRLKASIEHRVRTWYLCPSHRELTLQSNTGDTHYEI